MNLWVVWIYCNGCKKSAPLHYWRPIKACPRCLDPMVK